MNVLILGGTGAMGAPAAKALVQKGWSVTVTSRRQRRSDYDNLTYLMGDAKEDSFLKSILQTHWDVIVDFMVYSTAEFKGRLDLLLDAAGQYLFTSSARVYAASELPLTEESPRLLDVCGDKEYLSTDEYALAKARQEDILTKSGRDNWTIIRPGLTYNETRLQLGAYEKENWLYRALRGRSIVFSRDLLEKYYTLTYGRDVSEAIAALAGSPDALGETFLLVVEQAYRWSEILSLYLDVLEQETGARPKVVLTEQCTNLLIPDARYQVLYGRYYDRRFDNAKISAFVDTSKWLAAEAGLGKCLKEFLENPVFLPVNWQKEAYLDRAARERTPLKEISSLRDKILYVCCRYRLEPIYELLQTVKTMWRKVERLMMKDFEKHSNRGGVNNLIFGTGVSANKEYYGMYQTIDAALASGIRVFDTAPSYETEELLGRVLKACCGKHGLGREDIQIQTKIDPLQMQEGKIRKQIETVLKKMNLEYLDSLLIHWPVPEYFYTTWERLLGFYEEGSVRKIGVCNMRSRHLREMLQRTQKPHILQIERNPLRTCGEDLALCQACDIDVQAYSPLCKMEERIAKSEILAAIAAKYHKSIGQVVLKWQLLTGACPVFTSKKPQRIREYSDIFDFTLSMEERRQISSLNENYKMYLECCVCPGF